MKNEIEVTLKPVQTTRASEEIYEQIRQLILKGEIKPGEHLPSERKMMEMMQRSRPTIREAMRMLEREGYIRIQSGSSGAVVQEFNVDNAVQSLETVIQFQKLTIADILEFRRMTEDDAAALAAERRTEEDLAELRKIVQNSSEAIGRPEEFIQYDLQFHLVLARATRNQMYSIMMRVCRDTIEKTLVDLLENGSSRELEERYARIQRDHQALLDAVEEKNGKKAEEIMAVHLFHASKDIMEIQK